MPGNPQELTGKGFATRLGALYAALFLALGVQLPFLPLWLAAKGFDATLIGVALAVPMIVRVFAIPMATRAADRRDALQAAIVISALTAVIGYAALGLAEGAFAIILIFIAASAAYTPLMLLVDAYALRGLALRGRAYGPVRLWGSAAFIVANFGAGLLLSVMAPRDLIWLIVAGMALTAVAAVALAPLGPPQKAVEPAGPAGDARPLLASPAFLTAVGAASLIQASHAVYYGFSALDWQAAGVDGPMIGGLWALGVLAEMVLFALSGRLPAFVSPTALLAVGAAGATIRWTAMACNPPAALLPLLQGLHALSFGATHLGALSFVAAAAPPRMAATAQGYLGVALGLAMAGAMGLSGVLYARYGALAYGAMALSAMMGGCVLAAHRYWARR